MTIPDPTLVFANAAGCLAAHPAGYAVLRFAPGPWPVESLAELVTETGALLLARRWNGLLADVRQLPVFSDEALDWLQRYWFARVVPQPPRIFKALLLPASTGVGPAVGQLRLQAPAFTHYAYFADELAAHTYLATLAV
ncbi:hypothetical protein MON38_12100 [Hymenobacter sp. DH14]|uniref:Uncharacterized protein n=1 Tax=Hymenobacter cyanobacteriorum TaxID=2926463 RepID=A0A9X1VH55_9BACT|nr:hypothetical protein [Hymenobacter cyanobacteriorum]MCI1188162.1 hypothetical protein [Hymenobacter cyanobacteriorum]